jgi:iron complex outermembrane receptor protein
VRLRVICALAAAVSVSDAQAQPAASAQLPALKQLSIEELLEVDVTLPLRREEPVRTAPAAISVATSEDLRRSTAVSLPDALSNMTGLFVARFSAASWIATARGLASNASNKMLVMIDGRTVYSPLFSGVFWEQQDAMLEDLERIEVIRGPGASLWGSNAVNGVVNVVSKSAADTQGALAMVGGGAEERLHTALRYGGRVGEGFFRVYGKYVDRDAARLESGADAGDWQRFGQGGFRADFGAGSRSFTLQGDAYASNVGFLGRDPIDANGANLLARWTRRGGPQSELQVQTFLDHTYRSVPDQIREQRFTVDVELQHRRRVAARHTLAWGGGLRRTADDTTPTVLIRLEPEDRTTTLLGAFVQDDIAWSPRWSTIVGVKIERNDYTGVEVQPTGRVRWMAHRDHLIWGAVSRGVRLPTRIETDVRVTVGDRVIIAGNPDFQSESVVATEVGYRGTSGGRLAWDAIAFRHQYDNLRTQELGLPTIVGNGLNVASLGLSLSATVQPRPALRVTGGYTYLTEELTLDPGSRDPSGGRNEAIDPAHQAFFLARIDLPRGVDLDLTSRYVSALPGPGTPAYAEAGFRLAWRPASRLELALIGRDLLHDSHFEFISPTSARRTRLERAVFTRATVTF